MVDTLRKELRKNAPLHFEKHLSLVQEFNAMSLQNKSAAKSTARILGNMNLPFVTHVDRLFEKKISRVGRQCRVMAVRSGFELVLSQHAKNIEKRLPLWQKVHRQWHRLLDEARKDIEKSVRTFLELKDSRENWAQFFHKAFDCLPMMIHCPVDVHVVSNQFIACPANWHEQKILDYLGCWYESATEPGTYSSPLSIIKMHLAGLQKKIMLLPNREFNNRLPELTVPKAFVQMIPQGLPACDICSNPVLFYIPCEQCKDKLVCYTCIRSQAWSACHDEYRVLSEPKPIHCGFCRQTINVSELLTNVRSTLNLGPSMEIPLPFLQNCD